MSDTLDRLEILIGKFLDDELSPKERCLLESELERDEHAKELLEQMRTLHECSHGVVTHEILERGAEPAEVFERAWQQSKRSFWWRVALGGPKREGARGSVHAGGHSHWGPRMLRFAFGDPRFAAGLAAGLLLGLVLHFAPAPQSTSNLSNLPSRPPVAGNVPAGGHGPLVMASAEPTPALPVGQPPASSRQITREVDWYVYTDRAGNQWLIGGTHEGRAQAAAYESELQ